MSNIEQLHFDRRHIDKVFAALSRLIVFCGPGLILVISRTVATSFAYPRTSIEE